MIWDVVKAGFLDELAKIAAVDLRGLSPETLMSQQPPEPMMTEGYNKAKAILDRSQMMKTAGYRHGTSPNKMPAFSRLESKQEEKDPKTHAKGLFLSSMAGGGVGGAAAGHVTGSPWAQRWAKAPALDAAKAAMGGPGPADKLMMAQRDLHLNNAKWGAGIAGLGLGGGAYLLAKRHQRQAMAQNPKKMTKLSNLTGGSPATALKAAQQTARPSVTPSAAGPGINSQIGGSLIGRKGVPGA